MLGVILAGGRSTRLGGGDKALLPLAGRPLVAHVIERFAPQVDALVLNANGEPARFAAFGLEVVPDSMPGFPGPLAGILAGLAAARAAGRPAIVTATADAPFLPRDLVQRLAAAGGPAVARSEGRLHPVFGVFPTGLADGLAHFLMSQPSRRVADWVGLNRFATVDFAVPASGPDPFFNVNTPDDLAAARAALHAPGADERHSGH
jgi:molybdopterin-guanine dinucleotide biosynthesis protein A